MKAIKKELGKVKQEKEQQKEKILYLREQIKEQREMDKIQE